MVSIITVKIKGHIVTYPRLHGKHAVHCLFVLNYSFKNRIYHSGIITTSLGIVQKGFYESKRQSTEFYSDLHKGWE